jgi:lysylphosphatidylglycerol synthetase-like protein (DUF2156 family)
MQKKTKTSTVSKTPLTVKITLALILITAAFWFLFSLTVVLGGHVSYNRLGVYRWLIAALTFLVSLFLLALWHFLRRQFKFAWIVAVLTLAAMLQAGFLDELGWMDYFFIVFALVPLVLLIKDRQWYLARKMETLTKD